MGIIKVLKTVKAFISGKTKATTSDNPLYKQSVDGYWKTDMPPHENCRTIVNPIHDPTTGFRFRCGDLYDTYSVEDEMEVFRGFINFEKIMWGIPWTQRDISYLRTVYKTWAELEDFCIRVKEYYGVDEKMKNVQIKKELLEDSCGLGLDKGYYVVSVANEGEGWVEKARFNYDDNDCNYRIDCEDIAKASAISYGKSLEECTVGIQASYKKRLEGLISEIPKQQTPTVTPNEIKQHFNQYMYQKFDKNEIINHIVELELGKEKIIFEAGEQGKCTTNYDAYFVPVYVLDKVKGKKEMVAMFPYINGNSANQSSAFARARVWTQDHNK